jgi:DNA gyrase subunit A
MKAHYHCHGKRTKLNEYPLQRRSDKGVKNIEAWKRSVCCTTTAFKDYEILVTTKDGLMMRMPAIEIRVQGMATQRVDVTSVKPGTCRFEKDFGHIAQ